MANDSYDLIDRFLRNNLDDADYAEHSKALDSLLASHAGEPIAYANPVILLPDEEGGGWEAKVQSHCDDVFSLPLYATPSAATPAAPGEVTTKLGKRLAQLLDEDQWAECGALLLKLDAAPRALVAKWRHTANHLGLEGLASLADCADELEAALSHPATVAAPAPASEAEELSPDFTDTARAALLWVLRHHQGASSNVGQPIRFALGMGQYDRLNDHQISEAKRWASIAPYPSEADAARTGERLAWLRDRAAFATPTPGDSADAPVQQAGDGQSSCATKEPSVARQVAEKTGAASQVRKQFAHYQERSYMSNAAKDVLAERQRQISAEGWTPEHDDEHDDGRMAIAAAHYAMHGIKGWGRVIWPWDKKWLKPKDRRSNLIRASALIIAEIERIDRAALKGEQPEPSGSERGEV